MNKPFGAAATSRGKSRQRVGVTEGAVGAVGREHLDDRLDVVARHPDGVAGEQLLDLDDVGHQRLVHGRPISSVAQSSKP